MSSTDGGRAYDKYCAVAQITGRPVVPSSAAIDAPNAQPPNKNPPPVEIPGTTGSHHR